MEMEMECSKPLPPPPAPVTEPPQPSGRLNKAVFRLFSRRRTAGGGGGGGGMARFFSMRNKGGDGGGGSGGGGGGNKAIPRSKTHDGITATAADGGNDNGNTSTSPLSDTSEGGGRAGTLGNHGAGTSTGTADLGTSGRFFTSSGWFSASTSSTLPGGTTTTTPRGPLGKSISFFSLLRRNSVRRDDAGGSGGVGGGLSGRRRAGLRGFFSSWRWRRKPRSKPQQQQQQDDEDNEEVHMAKEVREGDVLSSRSGSAEVVRRDVTLMPISDLQQALEAAGSQSSLSTAAEAMASMHSGNLEADVQTQGTQGGESVSELSRDSPMTPHTVFQEGSPDDSPLRAPGGDSRGHGEDDNKLGSPARLASDSAQDPACMTPPMDRSLADPPSEPSVDRLCSMFNDVTSLKSFDSLTGCGDIIADVEDEPSNGNGNGNGASSGTASSAGTTGSSTGRRPSDRGSPAKQPVLAPQVTSPPLPKSPVPQVSPFLPAHQRVLATSSLSGAVSSSTPSILKKQPSPQPPAQGSGVVAYMGGGEEMASPEGVDDADMQGLWHMLPQKGEDSPDLPRSATVPSARTEKRAVKPLGLSKIPIGNGGGSGNGRSGKQPTPTRPSPPPVEKELQEAPPSDEGYWDSPTPVAEDDDATFLTRELRLPRESCSGDALYDLYDPDSPSALGSDDEDASSQQSASTGTATLSPRSPASETSDGTRTSFRSHKGSTSLPRESKIPVSKRPAPLPSLPHSSSQGELSKLLSTSRPTSPLSGSRPTTPISPRPPTPGSRTNSPAPPRKRQPLAPAKSSIPQPTRTRIPVSKVPVRRTTSGKSDTSCASSNSTRTRR